MQWVGELDLTNFFLFQQTWTYFIISNYFLKPSLSVEIFAIDFWENAAVLFALSGSWNINILVELETLVSIIGKFQVLIFSSYES